MAGEPKGEGFGEKGLGIGIKHTADESSEDYVSPESMLDPAATGILERPVGSGAEVARLDGTATDVKQAPEPEAIAAAKADVDARHEAEQEAKNAAIENLQKAEAELARFKKARNVRMQVGTPESLRDDIKSLQEKLAKIDAEKAARPVRKPSWLDRFRRKSEVDEISPEDKKRAELQKKLDEKIASIDKVDEANKDFAGKREDLLMWAVAEARREAEKH